MDGDKQHSTKQMHVLLLIRIYGKYLYSLSRWDLDELFYITLCTFDVLA